MHPVIARELRVAARTPGLLRMRFIVAAAACGVTAFFLLLSLLGTPGWGLGLERFLYYGALLVAVPQAFGTAVGLFTEERSSQNFGLLYLTGISGLELFASKLIGAVVVVSAQLLAVVPVFVIPLLSGGVSGELFLATICSMPAVLLLSMAVGVLAAALCRDESAAMLSALALLALLCGATTVPYVIGKKLTGSAPFGEGWLWLSPAFGPYALSMDLRGSTVRAFWINWVITIGWALLLFTSAAVILRRTWQEEFEGPWGSSWRVLLQRLFGHPSRRERDARRQRLLARNAYQWLTVANRRPVFHGSWFVAGVMLLWLVGWAAWPRSWPSTGNFFITAFVLITGVQWVIMHATARRFSDERRSGTLELLLTSPLTPEEIIDGHAAGIREQFRTLRGLVLGLCVGMLLVGFVTRTWTVPAVISYLVIWAVLLVWCVHSTRPNFTAGWMALNTASTMYALFRTNGGGQALWPLVSIIINLRNSAGFFRYLAQFPTGSTAELVFVLLGFVVAGIIYAARLQTPSEARSSIVIDMRMIAQQPVPERRDARLKNWNGKEPLLQAPDCDQLIKVSARK